MAGERRREHDDERQRQTGGSGDAGRSGAARPAAGARGASRQGQGRASGAAGGRTGAAQDARRQAGRGSQAQRGSQRRTSSSQRQARSKATQKQAQPSRKQAQPSRKQAAKAKGKKKGRRTGAAARLRERFRLSEKMPRPTRVRLFFQSVAPDFLLVFVVSVALSYTVSFGFHSAWDYRGNVALVAAVTLPMLIALFVGAWSKRTAALSVVASVAIGVITIGIAAGLSTESVVEDTPGNYVIFAIVIVVVTTLSFLLSRRTIGLVFLLTGAILACGLIQLLYPEWLTEEPGIPATLVAVAGIGMLFIYHCYKQSVYSAERVKRTSFLGASVFSAIITAVCVLVGLGVFYGIIAVSGLTTPDIKIFEEYVSPPVNENANDYETADTYSDETSSNTGEDEDETSQTGEGGTNQNQSPLDVLRGTAIAEIVANVMGVDLSEDSEGDNSSAWVILEITAIIIGLLIIAAIVAIILLQRYRRTWRLKRIAGRSNAYQTWYLYTFLLKRFARLKIRKSDHLTALEFAVSFSRAMVPFTRGTNGVDFVYVSSLAQDVAFGGIEPSDEDLDRVKGYYRAFFRNARIYVGWPKWILWKFWRI